jgi:hypothetical protein
MGRNLVLVGTTGGVGVVHRLRLRKMLMFLAFCNGEYI